MPENIFTRWGGRRYFMTMGCCAIATMLVIINKISGGEFVTLIGMAMAFYNAANTAQKMGSQHESSINQ